MVHLILDGRTGCVYDLEVHLGIEDYEYPLTPPLHRWDIPPVVEELNSKYIAVVRLVEMGAGDPEGHAIFLMQKLCQFCERFTV